MNKSIKLSELTKVNEAPQKFENVRIKLKHSLEDSMVYLGSLANTDEFKKLEKDASKLQAHIDSFIKKIKK